jgi:phosphoribosylglycinamide formyltransferase-1
MKNIVILISGGGSNMAAIVRAAPPRRLERASWRSRGGGDQQPGRRGGLALARERGLADGGGRSQGLCLARGFDVALKAEIDAFEPTLVVLAGFMRILTPAFVAHFEGRLLNIHPSLLPAFPGLHTHQRALDAGCQVAGATVHRVTPDLDHGPILAQAAVPVLPGDSAESLAARVLTQEHRIYPQAIARLLANHS